MREDFNKQLTERERLGHKMKFGDYRNAKLNKVLDEDMSGGKESIHARRRNAKGRNAGRKRFNENLNPLINFLRVNAGRPWDKIYSEITSTFDKRKVINNHILEHLFDYVELNAVIIDGKPHKLSRWSRDSSYQEITFGNPNYPTYYVDPRDGLMKAPRQETHAQRRSREGQEAKAAEDRLRKLYARIDDDNHLIFRDGIWFHYEAKLKPPKTVKYIMPADFALKNPGQAGWMLDSIWKALPESEKERIGKKVMVEPYLRDKIDTPDLPGFNNGNWYSRGPKLIPDNKYFFRRQTASSKQLKAAGIDGLIPDQEVKTMSHREASKYRTKKAGK